MEILLVRHGETGENYAHRHQPTTTSLNPTGRRQATAVAAKIVAWQPTHIMTSTYVRAIETAAVTAAQLDVLPTVSMEVVELKRPESMYGQLHFGQRSLRYMWRWFMWPESTQTDGEESYQDLLARITRAKADLSALPAEARVVVFSHSIFITFFLAHLCRPTLKRWWHAGGLLWRIKSLRNGSVTHVRYKESHHENCGWEVVSVGDITHLKT